MAPPAVVTSPALVINQSPAFLYLAMDFPVYHHFVFGVELLAALEAPHLSISHWDMAEVAGLIELTGGHVIAWLICSVNIGSMCA